MPVPPESPQTPPAPDWMSLPLESIPLSAQGAELVAALDGLLTVVERSAQSLENGDSLDLAGLDDETTALCNAVSRFSPPETRHFLPRMEALLPALERLEAAVKVNAALNAPERPARSPLAAAAYRRAEDPERG